MDIVQASFQASFDSRVERLGDVDLADLRVIFRFFDTDGDGAVSADQACRMFALLGLDVNATQVRELGEVYLNEFIKIVDSHVQPPPVEAPDPEPQVGADGAGVQPEAGALATQPPEPPLSAEETERKLGNDKALEVEWRLLDTYHRGCVSMQELRLFLASCRSTLSLGDTERFLETYGNTIERDGVEELEFTKDGFFKFRHEYTPKKMALSEDDLSSDEDDEDGHLGNARLGQRAQEAANAIQEEDKNEAASVRVQARHTERGPSDNSSDHVLSSREPEFVVNPDEFGGSDESDEDAAVNNGIMSGFEDGHDSARS